MRKFEPNEIDFIIQNEATMSLGKMAKILRCDWKEVYAAYDEASSSEAYKQRVLKRTQAIKDSWGKKKERENAKKAKHNQESSKRKAYYPKSLFTSFSSLRNHDVLAVPSRNDLES